MLEFSLEDVFKYKYKNNISYNNYSNNSINLYDCFTYYQRLDIMTGANSFYCKLCKMYSKATICTLLITSPEILILLLKRDQEQWKIEVYENLDLKNFIQEKNMGCSYKLIGVITYKEGINKNLYFYAYCRDPITDKWYKYDNININDVNDSNIVTNSINPFLLLYQKNK